METSTTNSTFFDDVNLRNDGKFWSYSNSDHTENLDKVLCEDYIITLKSKKTKGVRKKRYLKLVGNNLLCYNDKTDLKSLKYINLVETLCLLTTKMPTNSNEIKKNDESEQIIDLSHHQIAIKLIFKNIEQGQKWFSNLSKLAVLTTFEHDLKLLHVIRNANLGTVYYVQDRWTGKKSIAKLFPTSGQDHEVEKKKRMIKNEIQIMRTIGNHDEILNLEYVYEDSKFIALVFENFEGKSLANIIDKVGLLTEDECREIIRHLLKVLKYIHERGIIHRDLKPSSVYLSNQNKLKLADFGLSTLFGKTIDKKKCGTPGYIAPEILKSEPYGCKSDVFSAGAILYLALTGCKAFNGSSINHILQSNKLNSINWKKNIWNRCSQTARDVTRALMENDPNKRFGSVEALSHEWFNFVSIRNFIPSKELEYSANSPRIMSSRSDSFETKTKGATDDDEESDDNGINHELLIALSTINMKNPFRDTMSEPSLSSKMPSRLKIDQTSLTSIAMKTFRSAESSISQYSLKENDSPTIRK